MGGDANLTVKCKLCSRENSMDVLKETIKAYQKTDESFQTVVVFDCRGIEPTEFSPRAGWKVEGSESGATFDDVDLKEGEWCDYDEKSDVSVGVYDIQAQFVKVK